MTGTVVTQVKAIAFERDIERLTEGFIGREWIFEEIDRWLQQDDQRFFILTGEPGIGKSAIAAQLTQIRQDIAAYHFCIARRSGTIEPNNVLLSLAAQLVEYFPDYAETLANIIKPLKLSVNVEITIQNIKDSTVRGVVINNLHTQNPQEALNIILRQALAALPTPPEQPTLILIDSLDEAVTFSDKNNLITLLAGLNDLPPWVRLLLTSRPEDRVLVEFEPLEPHRIEEMSEQNRSDIREYVKGRVEQPAFQEELSKAALVPQTLIDETTKLSSGNFLYTKLLLNDIEAGRQALDDLSALPKSIDEIYLAFLRRFKPQEWRKQYQPILGTLTVTQEPVTEDELANFTGIDPGMLRQDLGIIRQFLDVIENNEGNTAYAIFHQSLRDYLLDKKRNKYFWCYAQGQHRLIIKYYENVSKTWQQLQKVDRYGRNHIAQHLVKAEQVEELHTLLNLEKDGKNAWFKVKDDEGDTAGFLADVELAWSQADEAYDCQADDEAQVKERGRSMALQCRYALIKASINSLVNIPAELMVALVKHQYWKPIKALAYARQMPEPKTSFESLAALADQLPNSEPLKLQVLQVSFQAAQAIQSESYRAQALTALADKLPEILPKAFEAALVIQDEYARAKVLITLSDKLPEALPKALEAVLALQNKSDDLTIDDLLELGSSPNQKPSVLYAEALTILARKLTPELLLKALAAALAIQNEYSRAQVLTALATKLTSELLPKALAAAQAIQDEYSRAQVLTALADKLPEALPKALAAAQAIQDEYSRAQALTTLADKLPEALPKALAAAQAIQDEVRRAQALTTLADKLPEALPQALAAALAIQDEVRRAYVLIALADKLPEALLPQALAAALAIQDNSRAYVLTALANKLTPELLPKALEATLAIHEYHQVTVLTALSDKFPEVLPKALAAALAIQDEFYYSKALTTLVGKLPQTFPEALEAIHLLREESRRAEALVFLADKVAPELLLEALGTALDIRDEHLRARALKALTGAFTPKLLEDLATNLTYSSKYDSTDRLATLLDALKPKLLLELLEAALAIQDEPQRAEALTVLSDKLPEALPKAFEAALAIQDEPQRAKALTVLSDKLPEALPKAFEAALAIQEEYDRSDVLTALANKLTPELLPKALQAALAMQRASHRAEVLTALVDKLPEVLPKALEAALVTQGEYDRANVLTALANKLTPELLPRALEAVSTFRGQSHSPRVIIALADNLMPELLPKVLKVALSIQPEYDRATALAALNPSFISASNRFDLWKDTLHFISSYTRPDLLSDLTALTPLLVALGTEAIATETAQAIQDVAKWWH